MTVAAGIVVAAALYGWGVARLSARRLRLPAWRVVAFAAGLGTLAGAVLGPMDDLADASLAWHMVQHLLLLSVVPPLLLLGAPIRVALGALPANAATRVARALNSAPMRIVDNPLFGLLVFVVVLYGTHFSPLYEAALENERIHAAEHALYLGAGLVYWSSILAVAPAPHAASHPARILTLFLSIPMSAFLGLTLYSSRTLLYPYYAGRPGALADQAAAGEVMWLTAGVPVVVALLWCVLDWAAREQRIGDAFNRRAERAA